MARALDPMAQWVESDPASMRDPWLVPEARNQREAWGTAPGETLLALLGGTGGPVPEES